MYAYEIFCNNLNIIIKENSFTNNFYNTIGVDFKIKNLELEDKNIKL